MCYGVKVVIVGGAMLLGKADVTAISLAFVVSRSVIIDVMLVLVLMAMITNWDLIK